MTGPRRARSVVDASAPLEHYLIPVPATSDHVCPVCRGPVKPRYRVCYSCHVARQELGYLCLDAVSFLSLAPRQEQMARDLATYKHANVPAHLRDSRSLGLAASLWRWLAKHEPCLASAAGSAGFSVITTVPSTRGRANEHPLTAVVGKLGADVARRASDVLTPPRSDVAAHEPAVDRFGVSSNVTGTDVLVLDDTWTSGANMQAASAALKNAGARRVAGLALGRWINTSYENNSAWLTDRRRFPWSWDTCSLC